MVAPDGSVTYTDRPPAEAGARVTPVQREAVVDAPEVQSPLPQALRQPATRYPVTLFSTRDCPPCEAGRQLLVQRGVPFTEKLVLSEDDAAAMERTLGTRTVPSLTIGTQALRGLSEGDWTAYLDAAGYPRASQLPKGWQAPEATPLVTRSAPAPAASGPPAWPRARRADTRPAIPLPRPRAASVSSADSPRRRGYVPPQAPRRPRGHSTAAPTIQNNVAAPSAAPANAEHQRHRRSTRS